MRHTARPSRPGYTDGAATLVDRLSPADRTRLLNIAGVLITSLLRRESSPTGW
jgi:hypothetical protein